ncbi:MAG: 16S rRNA (guanine(966)-N(2))-methyltransferase RsmD [Desulfuromonadales bacterium]|nr:16S rRNA (guanine(966)-N(2))-methyltransferase RsmD [Desulfuromonadales bacterium]
MRIIAGRLRGRRLTASRGMHTRPTADRVREALFSILYSRLGSFAGIKVLDMFAGSGALAIEALSRGARRAWLVEKSTEALRALEKNLISCDCSEDAEVVGRDLWQALPTLRVNGPYGLIFVDPPYEQGLAARALTAIIEFGLLADAGIACIETATSESLPEHLDRLSCFARRRYGSTTVHLYGIVPKETS